MPVIEIGPKRFISGESQSDYISDRGFSPDSINLNLTKKRGVLHFIESPIERGTATLTGNIIGATEDPDLATNNDALFIDDGGAFYKYSGTTLTKQYTDATAGRNWTLGTTDIIAFQGNAGATQYFVSSDVTIAKLDNSFSMVDSGWWATGLATGYRHPMEVMRDEMFLAHKNVIYFFNGTSSGTAFTLPPDVNVTTLRKAPDGRNLLAFTGTQQNASHTENGRGKVYYCDVVTRFYEREIPLDAQVEGSRNVGGTIYVTYGKNVGYFTGTGIQFLKKLETSGTTYSQSMNDMDGTLFSTLLANPEK